jgi:pyruvate dehydrogenase E1 component alpha subunit
VAKASAAKAPAPIAPPATSNRERPPEPQRHPATARSCSNSIARCCSSAASRSARGQLYGPRLIGGFCHLYIGQEAVAVGLQSALDGERTASSPAIATMATCSPTASIPKVIMAELTGRAAGISKGKGGSMHMFSVEHKFYGGHGIVGAQVSLGTGLAFKHKYSEDGGVCMAYFGDGAANQGQVYESFNMAELWKLPIIYVIENNQYAMGTSVNRASAEDQLYRRGESFRIPGLQVDGMDVLAVRGAATTALEWVRSGKGPILLELKTYRYRGHSMSDPAKYRSREEVQAVRDKVRPDRGVQARAERSASRGPAQGDRQGHPPIVDRGRRLSPSNRPSPIPAELYTDVLVETY